jgi:hypothetical protein
MKHKKTRLYIHIYRVRLVYIYMYVFISAYVCTPLPPLVLFLHVALYVCACMLHATTTAAAAADCAIIRKGSPLDIHYKSNEREGNTHCERTTIYVHLLYLYIYIDKLVDLIERVIRTVEESLKK